MKRIIRDETYLKQLTSKPSLTFSEARELCEEGYFVTHASFDKNESMHMWSNALYYDDGANLTCTGFAENLPEFLEEGWVVKAAPENINKALLDELHTSSNGYMRDSGFYEKCFCEGFVFTTVSVIGC